MLPAQAQPIAIAGARPASASVVGRAAAAAGRGALAVLDQGLFATATFAANLLLARWLPAAGYGAFAVGWSAFLLVAALHQAGFGEPQQALARARFADRLGGYLGLLARGHWLVAVPASALLIAGAVAAKLLGHHLIAAVLGGLAVAVPGTLAFWLARSACYAAGRSAVAGSAVFLSLVLGGLAALQAAQRLGPGVALATMGVAGLGAALVLRRRLRDLPRGEVATREVLAAHGPYAGWAAGSQAMGWLCANLHVLVLGGIGGLAAAGTMKALDTTLTPALQVATALSQIALPWLGAAAAAGTLLRAGFGLAAGFAALGLLGWATLALAGDRVLTLLYGPGFAVHARELSLYALMLVPYGAATAFQLGCRATLRGGSLFAYNLAFSLLLVGAYALAVPHGLRGMCIAAVAVQAATLPLAAWLFLRAAAAPGAHQRNGGGG